MSTQVFCLRGVVRPARNRAAVVLAAVLLVLVCGMAAPVHARPVVVTGEGEDKQTALHTALRRAVEQVAGMHLASQTKVADFVVEYDRMVTSSGGFVKRYDILGEQRDPASGLWLVKIAAEVDEGGVQSALEEFKSDPRHQQTFQQVRFDNRRVVVLYNKRTRSDLAYDTKGVQTLMDVVQDKLAGYGFRVFLPAQVARIRDDAMAMAVDAQTALQVARQENGDAVVVITVDAGGVPTDDGYTLVTSSLSLKSFDVTTGELFANVQARGKTITEATDYSVSDGVARIVLTEGLVAADNLTDKLVQRFSTTRQNFVLAVFNDVSFAQMDAIEDMLEGELRWKYRMAGQTGSYMELEILTDLPANRVRRTLSDAFAEHGLGVRAVAIKGSRVTFSGAR